MSTYFTGTTATCLQSIFRDGKLSCTPPHRVWKDYSEDYVYLIPAGNDEDTRLQRIDYAFEQAAYALYQLDHEQRVVLEIENLQEDFLETDPNAEGIYALQYSLDIPIENIKTVIFPKFESKENILKSVALDFFFRKEYVEQKKWINFLYDEHNDSMIDYENDGMDEDEAHEQAAKDVLAKLNVKYLQLVSLEYLLSGDLDYLSIHRMDIDERVRDFEYEEYEPNYFRSLFFDEAA